MRIRDLQRAVWIYLGSLAALSAGPVSAADRLSSISVLGDYTVTDSGRQANQGLGGTVTLGFPISARLQLEPTVFAESVQRGGGSGDTLMGLGADLRWRVLSDSAFAAWQPYLIGGAGGEYDHSSLAGGGSAFAPYLNAGVGVNVPVSDHWQLRTDVRNYVVFSSGAYPDKSVLDDWRIRLGLEYRFGSRMAAVAERANPSSAPTACCAVVPTTTESLKPATADSAAIRSANSAGLSAEPDTQAAIPVPAAVSASDRLCPPAPEGFSVDSHGCLIEQMVSIPTVRFASNTAKLTPDAIVVLHQFAEALVAQPQLAVEVDGNTDNAGSQYANLTLSRQRAWSVRDVLIAHGVNASRLSAEGYGSFRPLTTNATEDEREKNRRVDFRISNAP